MSETRMSEPAHRVSPKRALSQLSGGHLSLLLVASTALAALEAHLPVQYQDSTKHSSTALLRTAAVRTRRPPPRAANTCSLMTDRERAPG